MKKGAAAKNRSPAFCDSSMCSIVRRSGDAWCLVLPRLDWSRLLPLRLVVVVVVVVSVP